MQERGDKTNKIGCSGLVYKQSDKQTATSSGRGFFFRWTLLFEIHRGGLEELTKGFILI